MGVRVGVGGQEWYHSITSLWIPNSCLLSSDVYQQRFGSNLQFAFNFLRGNSSPLYGGKGRVRGSRVVPFDSQPMVSQYLPTESECLSLTVFELFRWLIS